MQHADTVFVVESGKVTRVGRLPDRPTHRADGGGLRQAHVVRREAGAIEGGRSCGGCLNAAPAAHRAAAGARADRTHGVDVRVADRVRARQRLPPGQHLVRQRLVRPVRRWQDREVPGGPDELEDIACYKGKPEESAACQDALFASDAQVETDRGNFVGAYPPVYYATMGVFAGPDIQISALLMRLFTIVLFLGLTIALYVLLPTSAPDSALGVAHHVAAARGVPDLVEQPQFVGGDRRGLGVDRPARLLRDGGGPRDRARCPLRALGPARSGIARRRGALRGLRDLLCSG